MILAVTYFSAQVVLFMVQTYIEVMGIDFYAGHVHKAIQVLEAAENTLEFAPMIAIVFLGARMRALQHDAQPQEWAQHCMYAATGAMVLSFLTSIIVPLTLGGTT